VCSGERGDIENISAPCVCNNFFAKGIYVKKFVFGFSLCVSIVIRSYAQDVTVYDNSTHQPLGMVVILDENRLSVTTGMKGTADFSKFVNSRNVIFRLSGYESKSFSYDEIKANNFVVMLIPKVFNLSEVLVRGETPQSGASTSSSSVNVLSGREFYRSDDIYLQNTLNTVPGVRMEMQSSTSQSNILIRGLGGKSQSYERDVRLYYNGIPLTDADGTTTLDNIDFTAFGSAQVIKGPTSILYGASTAGAINFYTKRARYREMDLNQVMTIGSDGLLRSNTNYRAGTESSNMFVNYGYQGYDGYREHSSSKKQFLTFSGDYYPSDQETFSFLALATSAKDQYPGEVDDSVFHVSPRAANPDYVQKNVGINTNGFLMGVTHTYDFTSNFENSSSAFIGLSSGDQSTEEFVNHPSTTKAGFRTVFSYSPSIGELRPNIILGTEIIRNFNTEEHYAFTPTFDIGDLNFNRNYDLVNYITFLQASLKFSEQTSVDVGARVLGANYSIQDLITSDSLDFSGIKNVKPYVAPLLAAVHRLNDNTTLYGNFSEGLSLPATSEISLSNGFINTSLLPEKTLNYEAGIRGNGFNNKFGYVLDFYYIRVKDSFVPQQVNSLTYLVNAGISDNKGFESYASYALPVPEHSFIQSARSFISMSYTNFRFVTYLHNGNDYSGKKFPGVAPLLFNAGLDVSGVGGLYLNLTYYFTDKRPLTDANSLYDEAFSLLNVKAGWRKRLVKYFTLHIFGGVDNATNTLYSSVLSVNQTSTWPGTSSPLYFNPSPARNYFGAVNIEFHFLD